MFHVAARSLSDKLLPCALELSAGNTVNDWIIHCIPSRQFDAFSKPWADLGEGPRGPRPPLFQNVFVRPQPFQPSWKSFYKMLFNYIFRNVNVTLHHEYAHNAVRSISWKVKFSFKEGGRGVGTRPLTNVCLLRISLSTVPTTYVLCVHTRGFVQASRSTAITSLQRAVCHLVCAGLECTHKRLLVFPH